MRELNCPLELLGIHLALDGEVQPHVHEAMRVVVGAIRDHLHVETFQPLPPLRKDVRHIGAHARGQCGGHQLHGRQTRFAVAVGDNRVVPGADDEGQVARPAKRDAGRGFGPSGSGLAGSGLQTADYGLV